MRKPLINPGIIKRLKSFFAIIQDTDTATRYIPAGKYVLYKNIACHASQNIESGDTLALGTNLVTDSDGFVNCLNDGLKTKVNTSDIVNVLTSTDSTKPLSAAQGKVLNDGLITLNSNIAPQNLTVDYSTSAFATRAVGAVKLGYLIFIYGYFTNSSAATSGTIAIVKSCYPNVNGNMAMPVQCDDGSVGWVSFSGSGNDLIIQTNQDLTAGKYVRFYGVVPCNRL